MSTTRTRSCQPAIPSSPGRSEGAAHRPLGPRRIEPTRYTTGRGFGMAVKPIPEGYHTLSAYLAVDDASEAIEYYKQAFGAKERVRMDAPGGKVGHAELEIGDSLVMLSDPFPQATTKPPRDLGGTSGSVFMYVENVDEVVKQAVDAGAT